MDEKRAYLLERFKTQGDYEFLPEGVLENMLDKLLQLDEEFMKRTGVELGEPYDDDEAGAALFEGMTLAFSQWRMYLMRLVEDYLDYNEDYLESIGAIEWD
ncbi:MAG: hypothetical protein BWY62_00486 [Firmicutes bacterium ADurb.Bin356]|nr:MAG: hypothetical protein BWY62_00486 [Firmicutes bacterium ADurb.Bin356]